MNSLLTDSRRHPTALNIQIISHQSHLVRAGSPENSVTGGNPKATIEGAHEGRPYKCNTRRDLLVRTAMTPMSTQQVPALAIPVIALHKIPEDREICPGQNIEAGAGRPFAPSLR